MAVTSNSSPLQIYKASAGSGKTYQLALKYITQLLGEFDAQGRYRLLPAQVLQNRHREILAITFTNKATQEMKQRIIKELCLLADPKANSSYRRDLHLLVDPTDKDLLNTAIDAKISIAAFNALVSMLFNLGDMNVSTIDSFFQRVLRSFAYEADLSGNYDLMLENKLMTNMAIDNMLAMACGLNGVSVPKGVSVEYLKERVKDLIVDNAAKEKQYRVFGSDSQVRTDLIKFISNLSGEEYLERKAQIIAFLERPRAIADLTKLLKKRAEQLTKRITATVEQMRSISGLNISGNGNKLLDKWKNCDFENFTEANCEVVSKPEITDILNKKGNDAAAIAVLETLFNNELLPQTRILLSINAMLAQMNFMALFREILAVERNLKIRTNTIMLSDTNELLHQIIDGSDTPFIYERIGQRLHYFLIDEFQDTSQMQWKNLLPLLKESMGSGHQNLVIGDVKQCIYRFRNSDPKLLQNLEQDLRLKAFGDKIRSLSMGTNWRSSKVVVEFNNKLFSQIASIEGVNPEKLRAYTGEEVCQKAHKSDLPGYVDIAICKEPKEDGFNRMVEHIRRQLDSGYKASQIVVLVRTNSEAKKVVEHLLEQTYTGGLLEGESIISDEALYVSASQAVQWIVGKLHQLDTLDLRTEKPLNKRGLPEASQTDIDRMVEILDRLNVGNDKRSLEDMIEEFNRQRQEQESGFSDNELERLSNGLSLFELVEELIGRLPNPSLRTTEAQFITAFQDLVYDYCASKSPTLHGFVDLWDNNLSNKAAVGLADNINAIRVMTIHKSKGLEFDVVHLPNVNDMLNNVKGHIWFDTSKLAEAIGSKEELPQYFPLEQGSCCKDLMLTLFSDEFKGMVDDAVVDEINTLYVAFTRAKQELIVTIKDSSTQKGGYKPYSPAWLLAPLLEKMQPSEDDKTWSFGDEHTKKTQLPEMNADTVNIDSYETEPGRDIWSKTKVVTVDDSGQPL